MNELTFKESVLIFCLMLICLALAFCSAALWTLAAALPYLIVAGALSVCAIGYTVTKCYILITESKARINYLENYERKKLHD